MKTNRSRKDLFGKMKKGTLIALLCAGCITASAQKIGGNVYGGGNAAEVGGNTAVVVVKGDIAENVFGGGCRANVTGYADVWIQGGTITKSVYGGNDITGTVQGSGTINDPRNDLAASAAPTTPSYVLVTGTPTITKNVFGGGNGEYDYITNSSTNPYYDLTAPAIAATTVKISAEQGTTDPVSHINNVFGGGNAAPVNYATTVDIVSGNIVNVYGGGNKGSVGISESNPGNTDVNVTGGLISGSVYGGGCQADVWGYADVLINSTSCNIGNVYGGNDITGTVKGNGTAPTKRNEVGPSPAATTNASYVRVTNKPAHINNVFGGGNGDYDYTTNSSTNTTYGLTAPTMTGSYVEIDMIADGDIDYVYGGGNKAEVGDAKVYVKNKGHIDYVFGGGNAATVTSSALVDINATIDGTVYNAQTVFGGNNQAQMNILPTINLISGLVDTVYGGGNAGAMFGYETKQDVFGNDVENLSTYIFVNSADIKITNAIYGGCKDAEVKYNTFVDIRNTHIDGIPYVFGGNDHSGHVGNTRVDAVNGKVENLFGASNGNYLSEENYLTPVNKLPICDSCNVNIYGGEFDKVYAGGYAGNVTNGTYLLLDDKTSISPEDGATINNNIFGGGFGVEKNALTIGATHYGNIGTETNSPAYATAITDAKHITELPAGVILYGGGNAGDVNNTLLTLYPTWDVPFSAIYGGCRASDVKGTAHTILQPTEVTSGYNSEVVFGGNDYAGTTHNSILDIHSGKYKNVYGAGNGKYEYTATETSCLASIETEDQNTIPVSNDATTNFYGGTITENLYGGSELGYIFKNDTNATYSNAEDYASIITNIHGGTIMNNVFGGAHGKQGGKQLAYAVKIVNMDGGLVNYSLHGGSESVNDGYPKECISTTSTTQRPSSIVNITGGTVRNRTFGGGYMGLIYGSTYINIGKHAVDSSEVWTKKFNEKARAYEDYKPTFVNSDPEGSQLMMNDLLLEKSIYSGADWGTVAEEGEASLYYNIPCFFGGKSEMLIDGRDYNSTSVVTEKPMITLNESLYGSGTSSEGGDITRIITLKNYGAMTDCENPERTLKSIQRADSITIQNVQLELLGTPSNVAAYSTPNYAISRADEELRFVDQNYLKLDAPIILVKDMVFRQHNNSTIGDTTTSTVSNTDLMERTNTPTTGCDVATANCDWLLPTTGTFANQMPKHTVLLIKQGGYIEIRGWKDVKGKLDSENNPIPDYRIDDDAPYGAVKGFGYILTDYNYAASVIARQKTSSVNTTDGGFLSSCEEKNNYSGTTTPATTETEFPYTNIASTYRVWNIKSGDGNRRREVNIVAHKNPAMLPGVNFTIPASSLPDSWTVSNGDPLLATAIADLSLPPSEYGNYYEIQEIHIDDETRTMNLTSNAYSYAYGTSGNLGDIDSANDGSGARVHASILELNENPQNKFGLTIQGWDNFGPSSYGETGDAHNRIIISGNRNNTAVNSDIRWINSNDVNDVVPTAKLTLTYSTHFETNSQRNVVLNLMEKKVKVNAAGIPVKTDGVTPVGLDSYGHLLEGEALVYEDAGPVEVVITIETMTDKLNSTTLNMLAMFNDGISNEYTRKVLLPATRKAYKFYLKAISWEPAEGKNDYYHMVDDNGGNGYENDQFSMKFKLAEDISSAVVDDNAWRNITSNNTVLTDRSGDIWDLSDRSTTTETELGSNSTTFEDKGIFLADLDSRFTGALDFSLFYDGTKVFPLDDIIGYVHFTFQAYDEMKPTADPEVFNININVKTRKNGDTIYIASTDAITRDGITVHPWNYGDPEHAWSKLLGDTRANDGHEVEKVGKMPDRYVQSIKEAMDETLTDYTEGDVLCILDEVIINYNFITRGTDYSIIQVVRYDGSHFLFPGEACAYRGPMIHIKDGGRFTAYNLRFDGKGISRRKDPSTTKPVGEGGLGYDINVVHGVNESDVATASGEGSRHAYLTKASSAKWFQRGSNYYYATDDLHKAETYTKHDTLECQGPIFLIDGKNSANEGSCLVLNNMCSVLNNFNLKPMKVGDEYYSGAITVLGTTNPVVLSNSADYPKFSNAPTVELVNNVTIEGNLVAKPGQSYTYNSTSCTTPPQGAGIHVKNGVVLLSTNKEAGINITKNYYVDDLSVTTATASSNSTPLYRTADGEKYTIDHTYFANNNESTITGTHLNSNVYLTRAVASDATTEKGKIFNDSINDLVYLKSELSKTTKIGINKWFPNGTNFHRDSIQFAMAMSSQPRANAAYTNENFVSDSAFRIFYHKSLEPTTVFFTRCEGYHLQLAGDTRYTDEGENLAAIEFRMNPDATSLPSYDSLLVHVRGGFFPRTYTWTDESNNELHKRESEYSSMLVKDNAAYKKQSNEDIYLIDNMEGFAPKASKLTYNYRVSAKDLQGCEVKKDIQVIVMKASSTPAENPFDRSLPDVDVPGQWVSDNSKDTVSGTNSIKVARTFEGISVEGLVNTSDANISSIVNGKATDDDYVLHNLTELNAALFSPGDVLTLTAEPPSTDVQFMFWDQDPYAPATTNYIVPNQNSTVKANFAPTGYWYNAVHSRPTTGYTTDYGGNVTISTADGLAWLISVVNGLNGQQTRQFYYDTVFINPGTYDMGAYLWTPVGTDYHKFMGKVMPNPYVANSSDPVVIKNIILNEPNMNNVGFFGVLDNAEIIGITLENPTTRGLQYVGSLAAKSENETSVSKITIDGGKSITTYASGGVIGGANNTTIENANIKVDFIGSAIYNGGVAGTANNYKIENSEITGTSLLTNVVYQAGAVGLSSGTGSGTVVIGGGGNGGTVVAGDGDNGGNTTGGNTTGGTSTDFDSPTFEGVNIIANNYIVMTNNDNANVSILGGIAGKAENTALLNNYVYGDRQHGNTTGAIVGQIGDSVVVSNCFYETGMANNAIGSIDGENQSTSRISSFNGEGNHVTVSEAVGGTDNLTRILNNWVRQQPEESNYNTWRSDLEHVNNGYPVFGTPDIIPVYDTIEYTTCDFYEWNGEEYYESGAYTRNYIVEDQYIDSTVTLMLTINSSMMSEFADSVELGLDYYGYGFNFSTTEQELLRSTIETEGFATIEFFDTLQTVHGCDSVISLTLTVYDGAVNGTVAPEAVTVKVYPNPTTSIVNVEATGLKEVEVYDNASRRIADSKVDSDHCIINLNNNASGSYYLRIYTKNGVAIRKVIKK